MKHSAFISCILITFISKAPFRGIYSSICADTHRRFAGEKCGQNVIKKWSLAKKEVPTNGILFKGMFFSLHNGNEVRKKGP